MNSGSRSYPAMMVSWLGRGVLWTSRAPLELRPMPYDEELSSISGVDLSNMDPSERTSKEASRRAEHRMPREARSAKENALRTCCIGVKIGKILIDRVPKDRTCRLRKVRLRGLDNCPHSDPIVLLRL